MKTEKKFKAYIAANKFSAAFYFEFGDTAATAIAAVKIANKDWRDCYIWCVYIHEDGQEEKCEL